MIRPVSAFSDDNLVRYRGKPHENVFGYSLNSKGFKDVEYPLEKPENTFRIVAIGDSFAFSPVAYPDNFLTILEGKLGRTNSGKRIEIINMGIVGLGPMDYLRLLNSEALAYDPDMVMVFFFVGNDIYLKLRRQGAPEKPKSYLLAMIKRGFVVFRHLDVLKVVFGDKYGDEVMRKNREEYLDKLSINVEKYLRGPDGKPLLYSDRRLRDQYYGNLSYIYEMKRACGLNGSKFVVVLIPEDMQINDDLRDYVKNNAKVSGVEPGTRYAIDFTIPQVALAGDLDIMGISYIDLYGYFRRMHLATGGNYFMEYDGHWNVEGNRLAAEALLAELEKGSF